MDINEIHYASGVGIRTLKRLEKLGVLKVTKSSAHPELARIRAALRRGNPLTAYQLVSLYRYPDMLEQVGDARAKMRAENAIEFLGDVKGEACPWSIAADIPGAAIKEKEAIASLAAWITRHIDTHAADYAGGKPHGYLAARMLHEVPENLMSQNYPVLAPALIQIRKHPRMSGYSRILEDGKTFYTKPLDL